MWTQKEIKEMNEFDYEGLFNSVEVEEENTEVEVAPKVEYKEVRIVPTVQDMKHHFARLMMMKAEERGEHISYSEALNF